MARKHETNSTRRKRYRQTLAAGIAGSVLLHGAAIAVVKLPDAPSSWAHERSERSASQNPFEAMEIVSLSFAAPSASASSSVRGGEVARADALGALLATMAPAAATAKVSARVTQVALGNVRRTTADPGPAGVGDTGTNGIGEDDEEENRGWRGILGDIGLALSGAACATPGIGTSIAQQPGIF